jgi:hypothetical protein
MTHDDLFNVVPDSCMLFPQLHLTYPSTSNHLFGYHQAVLTSASLAGKVNIVVFVNSSVLRM